MRLGGPVSGSFDDPQAWANAVIDHRYRAAYCPVSVGEDDTTIQAYMRAAESAGIVLAEVGAWSNPLSPDDTTRKTAIECCQQSLDLADRINARCCVNIAGSRGEKWDGPAEADLTDETFDMIVESVRGIIDAVKPRRSFYTLEPMPWMYPDSPESYLRLIQAIDRPAFAVHLDPVNMINCPERYVHNGRFLKECFDALGPYIKSVHAKDILLRDTLTVHLQEVRPGLGRLDYRTFLQEMTTLDPDMPLMLEHLPAEDEYRLAADYVIAVAQSENIPL